jgi:hypothetical protein
MIVGPILPPPIQPRKPLVVQDGVEGHRRRVGFFLEFNSNNEVSAGELGLARLFWPMDGPMEFSGWGVGGGADSSTPSLDESLLREMRSFSEISV